jgi:cobalamin-dependent methionine synthase I
VPVASSLLSKDQRQELIDRTNEEYDRLRKQHAGAQAQNKFIPLAEARANGWPVDWSATDVKAYIEAGSQVFEQLFNC